MLLQGSTHAPSEMSTAPEMLKSQLHCERF